MVERTKAHPEAKARFGAEVRLRRNEAKLTIPELAEKCGYSHRHISDIELGKKSPTLELICAIAEALAVPPSALLITVDAMSKDGFRFVGEQEL